MGERHTLLYIEGCVVHPCHIYSRFYHKMSESFELFSNVEQEDAEYEYERMTSSEVLEKLEEVGERDM